MNRWFDTMVLGCTLAVGTALAPGCVVGDSGSDEDELASAGPVVAKGAKLFNQEEFGGNGRTCKTCHPSEGDDQGTLSPADVEALFQADPSHPLFQHDGADVFGGNTFDRIREHATVLVDKDLPPNVSIVGSDARSVVLARGIPSTMNTPALDGVLMYDGRAPNLQEQALGAITGHAQADGATPDQLDAIATFQQTLFNSDALEAFADDGVPLAMPYGTTESEKRGRRFFISDADTDPNMVGEGPEAATQHFCGVCHSGPMLNETSSVFGEAVFPGVPEGTRFFTVFVSELNPLGNPVVEYEFTNPDGSVTTIPSADPGLALVTGDPRTANFFKIPTVWGVEGTAPYFHDNSSKTLEELMDHYAIFLNIASEGIINLSEQDKADIIAYMKLL